jgi:hypothetical protein
MLKHLPFVLLLVSSLAACMPYNIHYMGSRGGHTIYELFCEERDCPTIARRACRGYLWRIDLDSSERGDPFRHLWVQCED